MFFFFFFFFYEVSKKEKASMSCVHHNSKFPILISFPHPFSCRKTFELSTFHKDLEKKKKKKKKTKKRIYEYRKNNIAKIARDVAELFSCNIEAAGHGVMGGADGGNESNRSVLWVKRRKTKKKKKKSVERKR